MFDSGYENPEMNLHKAFVYEHNVLDLLKEHDVPLEPDLMSMDIDSQDWHVVRAIMTVYRPRVWVTEFNCFLGYEDDKIQERGYESGWNYQSKYYGASLKAFKLLMD